MADETAEETKAAVPPLAAPSFSRFIMIFLFIMGLYVAFVPGAGEPFAIALGVVLNPLLGFGGRFPVITILLAGLMSTTISSVFRHRFTDWVKMAKAGRTANALRKDIFEATRKGNLARAKRLREVQLEKAVEMNAVQMSSMKGTAYTFLFLVVLFIWLNGEFVHIVLASQDNLYFAVPWSFDAVFTGSYVLPTWALLYSLLAIPFSQIVVRVLKYWSFSRKLRDLDSGAAPEAPA